jgi:SAM-dependent methyltransferase
MVRLDYDQIAHLYDERGRAHQLDANLVAFLSQHPGLAPSQLRVLDVGCGTGRQLAANRDRFPDMFLAGVDRFEAMLRIAQRRCPSAAWIQADGSYLPLGASRFNYATSQFSYQHIRNTRRLLAEVFRVLTPGGRFVMINIDPWSMPGWLVYRFFPEALEADHRDFVPVGQFVAMMNDIGFRHVRVASSDMSRDETLNDFLTFASSRHRASQLMTIHTEAYETGLQRLRAAIADAGEAPVTSRSDFVLVTIAADKPGPEV